MLPTWGSYIVTADSQKPKPKSDVPGGKLAAAGLSEVKQRAASAVYRMWNRAAYLVSETILSNGGLKQN